MLCAFLIAPQRICVNVVVINLKQSKMKNRIIEICELGQPQSIIHRENQPITELIKTDSLIEELNQQLRLLDVVKQSELLCDECKTNKTETITLCKDCYLKDSEM